MGTKDSVDKMLAYRSNPENNAEEILVKYKVYIKNSYYFFLIFNLSNVKFFIYEKDNLFILNHIYILQYI